MKPTEVEEELERYIRKEFLDGDTSAELTATSPLLEWGVLNSINTVRIIAFVAERFDVRVPPLQLRSANFRDIECLARMVLELRDR